MKFGRELIADAVSREVAPYQSRLQLERAPFDDSVVEGQFFADAELLQRIELLQHLVQYSELLLIVTGPEGAGKTTLLEEFSGRENKNWCTGKLDGARMPDSNTLLASIAENYELDPVSIQEDLPQRLVNHWKALQLVGKYAVLFIDNAHCMDKALLQVLLQLDGSPRATLRRVRIVLFSEPGLVQRLVQEVFQGSGDAALAYNVELAPLSEQQTNLYLAYRLAIAGYSGASPFSAHQVHSIHKVSAGWPSRINELAHQTLLKKTRKEALHSGGDAREIHWLSWPVLRWGLVLLIFIGLLMFGFHDRTRTLTGINNEDRRIAPLEIPELVKMPADRSPVTRQKSGTEPVAADITALDSEQVVPGPSEAKLKETVVAAVASDLRGTADSEITIPLADTVADTVADTAEADRDQAPVLERSIAPPVEADVRETQLAAVDQNKEPTEAAAKVEQQKLAASLAQDKDSKDRLRREAWILEQDPGQFTLQLISVRDEAAVAAYIKVHGLTGDVAVFEKLMIGTSWYTLIHGVYASRQDALTAGYYMARSAPGIRPWVRQLAVVQTEVRQFGRRH